jgi:hypothetical protein
MKKGSRATTFFAIIHLIQYTQKNTNTLALTQQIFSPLTLSVYRVTAVHLSFPNAVPIKVLSGTNGLSKRFAVEMNNRIV